MMLFFFPLLALLISVRAPKVLPALLALLLPSYVLRTTIFGIPTTALELTILAAAIGTAVGLLTKRISWHFVSMTKTTWILLVVWIVAWVLAVVFSIDRIAALGALKAWLLDPLIAVAIVAILVTTSEERLRFVQSIILSGCSVALFGIVQFIFFHSSLQDGRLSSYFFPVANYAAMFLGPILILTIGGLFQSILSKRWWIAAGVQGVALLLTLSYGGFLSVTVGGILLLLFLPNKKIRRNIFLGGIVAGILFIATLSQTKNFREHFAADRSSGVVRTQIWVTSWAIIRQHPITGIGPNTFERAYRSEIPKHYFPPLEWLVAQPHNLYLALWLETGVLGLMSFFALLVYHVRRAFRVTLSHDRAMTLISLAALATILVHGFVDTPYFKNDLAIQFLFLAILPWLGKKISEQS